MSVIHIKSKFDSEFRRFSIPLKAENPMSYGEFRGFVETVHALHNIPFTLCYTSAAGDLLPITNDENFRKAFESSQPCLRLLIQRKGESWEEKYGYGTDTFERKRKGLSLFSSGSSKAHRRNYNISNPEDFRQVSAIIDVDVVPDTHRRVRLCKHGSDRPLGFYIRTGSAVRLTSQGAVKVDGIFISRLVDGGLAESTGLLGINDEVIEVNGIDVQGKSIDQVTDMMVANAQNLIVTTKPANQRNTLHHRLAARQHLQQQQQQRALSDRGSFNDGNKLNSIVRGSMDYRHSPNSGGSTSSKNRNSNREEQVSYDSDEDEIVDHLNSSSFPQHR